MAANPDGCPAPDEPISGDFLQRYGDNDCFPAGVTLDGWWHRDADGVILIGQRPGSVDARVRDMTPVTVSLRADQTLPSASGFGRFIAPTVSSDAHGIADAVVTPLPNAAAECPRMAPVPVKVFMDSLASCWTPGADVRIAGWRDTLDGLCGCGPIGYDVEPKWLMSEEGIGWLFAEPWEINLDDYLTLYASDEEALGTESGQRPAYMEVTGHFDDAVAATCRAVPDPDADPALAITEAEARTITASLRLQCADRFVATSVREVVPPLTALAFCPAEDPIPVASILAAPMSLPLIERLCFGGGDLAITGWFDPRPSVGLEPSIDPEWLDPFGRPGLWSNAEDVHVSGHFLYLFTDPANDVALPASAGSYTMTGHFDDPAAVACVRTDGLNTGLSAAEDCRSEFVVTSVTPGQG